MQSSDEKFSSQDIPVVAFLLARGHQITGQFEQSSRMTFIFKKSKILLEDLFDYGNNIAMPIQDFYRSLSRVWSLIKQEKRENG